MYQWLLFLHVGSVLIFMLAHGVQVTVTWKKRGESDPARNEALFDVLSSSLPLRFGLLAVFVTGFLLAFERADWSSWWLWISVVLLGLIWLLMWRWGGGFYGSVSRAGEEALRARGTTTEAEAAARFERARLSWRAPALMIIGIGGVAVILWLMIFRPL